MSAHCLTVCRPAHLPGPPPGRQGSVCMAGRGGRESGCLPGPIAPPSGREFSSFLLSQAIGSSGGITMGTAFLPLGNNTRSDGVLPSLPSSRTALSLLLLSALSQEWWVGRLGPRLHGTGCLSNQGSWRLFPSSPTRSLPPPSLPVSTLPASTLSAWAGGFSPFCLLFKNFPQKFRVPKPRRVPAPTCLHFGVNESEGTALWWVWLQVGFPFFTGNMEQNCLPSFHGGNGMAGVEGGRLFLLPPPHEHTHHHDASPSAGFCLGGELTIHGVGR